MSTDTNGVVRGPLHRSDLHIAALLFLASFVACWFGYQLVAPEILHFATYDYWFESDIPDVYVAMLDRWAMQHWRAQHHPLFPLLTTPPTIVLERVVGMSAVSAVGVVTAAFGGLFVASIFLLLRLATLGTGVALVWTGVGALSSASVFWLTVPEAYALGAVSIVPALMLVARPPRPGLPGFAACVVASALAFGGSTNNWSVGLLMLVAVLPWRRAIVGAVLSLCLVWVVWKLGTLIVPPAPSFLHLGSAETNYLFNPIGGGPTSKLGALFSHALVLPELREVLGSYLSPQGVRPGSGGILTAAATLIWAALLGLGVASAVKGKAKRLSVVAGLAILSQAVFYLAFGIETFHYSVQVIPLFVAFVAPAALGPWRRPATILAALFVVAAGTNNVTRFQSAARDLHDRFALERAFTERVAELTDPSQPVILGARAAAAESWRKPPPPQTKPQPSLWEMGRFPELNAARGGWHVYFDHWSIALIESYRAAGAAYFVSSYRYGLERSPELLDELDARYERLERTPDWVIYRLHPEKRNPTGS